MKRLLALAVLAFLAASCSRELKKENARLKAANDSLQTEQQFQDSTINDFAETFETVQKNLAEIRAREESIRTARSGNLETTPELKEQILADVDAINNLIENNKQSIQKLKESLSGKNQKIYSLNKMIDNLNRQIKEKDLQITLLKESLASANFKMEQLNARVGNLTEQKLAQQKLIEDQKEALNTVYYAVGTAKELSANKVIDKEGGFIGIGRTKTLADDFNRDYFTQANRKEIKEIPLNLSNDKAKLVTSHPSESYEWVLEDKAIVSLRILDSEEFWKSSRYLVVLID